MDAILKKININLKYNKLIILGGIYSNYEAFKRFLSIVKQTHQKNSFIVNTGDMFAYFSDPNKVIDLVRENKIQSIMGNCEESVAFNTEDCGCGFKKESACDLLTNQWYQYSKKNISANNKKWLKKLPYQIVFHYKSKKYLVCHGSPKKINDFVLPSTKKKVLKKLINTYNGVIAGHCGIPFTRYFNNSFWHNSGAIGMPPNDGTLKGWYSIINLENNLIEHKSFTYNHLKTYEKMKKKKLSTQYARSLKTGYWPSSEILKTYDHNFLKKPITNKNIIFLK